MKLVLASQSPRRSELLKQIGLTFTVQVSQVEETITEKDPQLAVRQLARQKAAAVAAGQETDTLVIGADTVVVLDGKIMGKPQNQEEACEMLELLQGREHSVYTGVALLKVEKNEIREKLFSQETRVRLYPMSKEEIQWYVSTGEPMDKAGAYGIQGLCARFIERIHGDYNNVVGLPVGQLYQEIKEFL